MRARQPRGRGHATRPRPPAAAAAAELLGPRAVGEQLAAAPAALRLVWLAEGASQRACAIAERAERSGVAVRWVAATALAAAAVGRPHQGVVAFVRPFAYADWDLVLAGRPSLVVALDGIQDPHNLGAIVRSAWAMGAACVVVPADRACPVTPAVTRAAAGGCAHMPVARVVNLARALAEARAAGLTVVGLAADAGVLLDGLPLQRPLVLVVGGEQAGLRPGVARGCDWLARLPMPGQAGALNASVACGMALYEVVRQQAGRGALTAAPAAP